MDRIGVRELRQNASVYLRRVAAGESFTVTDRGHPVAELRPVVPRSRVDEMLATGALLPPERPTGALSGNLPEPLDLGFSASDELARLRDEERW
ncbi:prevent-host-death family protein [Amycolatopsis arida]|uniref:Antitoxin n=1 Tax=Amycolatopsis arida TaxID=587909 RepID=A0A1I5KL00_9PSEU|nr:type II toxin-antitoxin system prevent-host-death family antitoxin [Amycolatopsis arida]TDX97084.1 prevent-host-death family protein [Amycolatopsis arida]SFO85336.1 prevent-host-death family protein [Amycolatopsis arida]